MFKFRLNLTVFFLLVSGIAAFAQNAMLRGTVLDENDLPLSSRRPSNTIHRNYESRVRKGIRFFDPGNGGWILR